MGDSTSFSAELLGAEEHLRRYLLWFSNVGRAELSPGSGLGYVNVPRPQSKKKEAVVYASCSGAFIPTAHGFWHPAAKSDFSRG